MDATVHKFPEKKQIDKMVDALFQCLPANSHREIARSMSKQLGCIVRQHHIAALLAQLRHSSGTYGWTVPHAKRGKRIKNEDGYRFFQVLVNNEAEPYFDPGQENQLRAGMTSTISHAATSFENEAEAIRLGIPYCKDLMQQKWLRSFVRRIKQMAEDANEVVDMLGEGSVKRDIG